VVNLRKYHQVQPSEILRSAHRVYLYLVYVSYKKKTDLSWWLHCLRRVCAAARLLGLRFRILPGAWIFFR